MWLAGLQKEEEAIQKMYCWHQQTAAWNWGKFVYFAGAPCWDNNIYQHHHHNHASIRRSSTLLALSEIPSPGPSGALMTPGRLARNYLINFYYCGKHPDRRCRPGTPQGPLWSWCMDPDRTWGRAIRRNMLFWWILLLFLQGFVFHSVQGELPFMSGNNAAMLVNWWVEKKMVWTLNCLDS